MRVAQYTERVVPDSPGMALVRPPKRRSPSLACSPRSCPWVQRWYRIMPAQAATPSFVAGTANEVGSGTTNAVPFAQNNTRAT